MTTTRALQAILAIAFAGIAFSGVLTYRELFAGAPSCAAAAGGTGLLFGLPVCVYGLLMYLAVATVAALGLRGAALRGMREVHG